MKEAITGYILAATLMHNGQSVPDLERGVGSWFGDSSVKEVTQVTALLMARRFLDHDRIILYQNQMVPGDVFTERFTDGFVIGVLEALMREPGEIIQVTLIRQAAGRLTGDVVAAANAVYQSVDRLCARGILTKVSFGSDPEMGYVTFSDALVLPIDL